METEPARLRDLARTWGVSAVRGQALDVLHAAIAAAYRREVEAEERRAMHARAVARLVSGA